MSVPGNWTAARRRLIVLGVTGGVGALLFGAVVSAPVGAEPPPSLEQVQGRVDALHAQAVDADERYNAATDELIEVQRRAERAQLEVTQQAERVKQLSASLGAFAAMTYRGGGIDPAIQTLLADDPRDFMASASAVEAYASQQTAQISVVAKARQQFAETSALAEEELARETVLRDTIAAEKATFDGLLAEQEALLAKLTAEEKARLAAEQERQQAAARASRDQARAALAAEPAAPEAVEETPDAPPSAPASGRAAQAVEAALSKLGSPYGYGASGPGSFDCSGLMLWAWGQAGVSLPRTSGGQAGLPNKVSADELQPGDILFYDSPVSHVAMYIGDGQVVHASNPRTDVIIAPAMNAGGSSKPFRGAVRPG